MNSPDSVVAADMNPTGMMAQDPAYDGVWAWRLPLYVSSAAVSCTNLDCCATILRGLSCGALTRGSPSRCKHGKKKRAQQPGAACFGDTRGLFVLCGHLRGQPKLVPPLSSGRKTAETIPADSGRLFGWPGSTDVVAQAD